MRKTKIDYVRFRTQSGFVETFRAIKSAFYGGCELLELGPEIQGKDGWTSRRQIFLAGDTPIAAMDYGGESQRGWLRFDMSGKGCEWVEDWDALAGLRTVLDAAELRRVDICLDTYDGSISHESVISAYEKGLFKRSEGGRNPKLKKVETSCVTDGRTIYIGSRSSSPRFIRCYEKGWEVVSKMGIPSTFLKPGLAVDFLGDGRQIKASDFYRVEVELKPTDDVVVPWPCLTDSDSFFAGASLFCQDLVDAAPRRAQAIPSQLHIKAVLASQVEHARRAVGGLFRVLIQIHGDDVETKARLFDEFTSDKPSERLIREGILTITD